MLGCRSSRLLLGDVKCMSCVGEVRVMTRVIYCVLISFNQTFDCSFDRDCYTFRLATLRVKDRELWVIVVRQSS